ncbi:hypothetical protein SprV_0401590600 [Sparganum proliferum]
MALRLPSWGAKFAVAVSAYASPITSYDKVKDKFYKNPRTLLVNLPKADKLFVLGGFNSCYRTEHTTWEVSAAFTLNRRPQRQQDPPTATLHRIPSSYPPPPPPSPLTPHRHLLLPSDAEEGGLDASPIAAMAPAEVCSRPEAGSEGRPSDKGDL